MRQKHPFGFMHLSLGETSKWIILIILAGFVARVSWWAYAKPIPVSDFEHYRRLAEDFLKHGQLGIPNPSAYRLPAYPIFLAIILLPSDSIAWLSFSNVLLSTLLIYIVYRLAFHLTSEKLLSIIAALICAFNPTFVFFSPILASEHLYVILLFSAFLVLVNSSVNLSTNWVRKPLIAGILFGTSVLTRGEGLFFMPILLAMTYLTFNKNRYRYPAVLSLILGIVITIAPWYVRNHYLVGPGSGLSTTGGLNFYYAHNENHYGWHSVKGTIFEGKDEVQQQKLGYQLGLEYLANASLLRVAKDTVRGTIRLFLYPGSYSVNWSARVPSLEPGTPYPSKQLSGAYWFNISTWIYYAVLLAAILSCLFLRRYALRIWVFLYGMVVMNWIGYALIFWGNPRYRYVSEVIFCILAAQFLYEGIKYLLYHNPNLRSDRNWRLTKRST